MPVVKFIAVLATTLFAGAAFYINVAEHPARMECGTAVAATVLGPSYRRAATMQAAVAVVATIALSPHGSPAPRRGGWLEED